MTWHVQVITSWWVCDVWVDSHTQKILDTGESLKRFRNAPYACLLRWVRSLPTFQRIDLYS